MKKILFVLFIIYIVFVIGLKVNYNSNTDFYIGDKIGSYYYVSNDLRVEDIISNITDNIDIKDRKIQNLLVKSNNIYIDLNSVVLNKNSFKNIKSLLEIIRYYSKENLIIKLRREDNIIDKKFNTWILSLKDKYDIIITR